MNGKEKTERGKEENMKKKIKELFSPSVRGFLFSSPIIFIIFLIMRKYEIFNFKQWAGLTIVAVFVGVWMYLYDQDKIKSEIKALHKKIDQKK